jgi:hypothetical protein
LLPDFRPFLFGILALTHAYRVPGMRTLTPSFGSSIALLGWPE